MKWLLYSPCSSEVEGRRAFDELEAKHTLVEGDRCFHGLALERDVVQADERDGRSRVMLILFMEIHRGFTGESPAQVCNAAVEQKTEA